METADGIVIGAGVQGASLAFVLVSRGAKVVVLERSTVAAGATGRSSGLVRIATAPRARLECHAAQYVVLQCTT